MDQSVFLTRHFILCLFKVRALCFVESVEIPNTFFNTAPAFIRTERVWQHLSPSHSPSHFPTHTHKHKHTLADTHNTEFLMSHLLCIFIVHFLSRSHSIHHNLTFVCMSFVLSHTHSHKNKLFLSIQLSVHWTQISLTVILFFLFLHLYSFD